MNEAGPRKNSAVNKQSEPSWPDATWSPGERTPRNPDGGRPPLRLLGREQAILEFNRRVLAQAQRADVPLLERFRYVCIVSSNLD